ncbi:MAG: alpha-ribazole phosphatase [Bacteroidota bacterium]
MTNLYLIRHTTPAVAKGICYGSSDLPLADSFDAEVEMLLPKIPQVLDCVYSSPAQRCLQLAERLTSEPLKTDARLWEMDFGDWELRAWQQLPPEALQRWMNDFIHVSAPQGESFEMLYTRVQDFWQASLAEIRQYKNVALVAHAGSLRSLLTYILQIPLQKAFIPQIDYGGVSLLKIYEDSYRLAFLNH